MLRFLGALKTGSSNTNSGNRVCKNARFLFLNANTGLKSRFNNTILFEDYTEDELLEIYKGFSKNENFILDVGVEGKIKDIFKELKNDKHFGNGRVARQLFASHLSKLNNRISRLDLVEGDERLFLITVEDL